VYSRSLPRRQVAVGECTDDLASNENLARRHARLRGAISFQLGFRVSPVPNSEGPGPPAAVKLRGRFQWCEDCHGESAKRIHFAALWVAET
jgi:hypothetical protein